MGVAYSMREKLYFDYMTKNKILINLKWLIYKLLSLFIEEETRYTFNSINIDLNSFLQNNQIHFWCLLILSLIYYMFVILIPFIIN